MLTALLTSIQTSLTGSRAFVLAALFPVTLFGLASAALLYRIDAGFRAWIFSGDAARVQVVAVVGLVWITLAYVLSALAPTLLEALEGKHPPVSWVAGLLHSRHWERRRSLWTRQADCGRQEAIFEGNAKRRTAELEAAKAQAAGKPAADPVPASWQKRLTTARQAGVRKGQCADDAASAPRVADVMLAVRRGRAVPAKDMGEAVNQLAARLEQNSAEMSDSAPSEALRRAHEDLLRAIDEAWARHRFERIRLYNLLQFRYPGPFDAAAAGSSASSLAPTAIGNVGRTVRSYALTRYNMDLDIFWTRLQKTLQLSKDFHGVLQDTKILLDALVALTWLAALFTLGWTVALPWLASATTEFLFVGIAGPLLTFAAYRLACRSYLVFADLLRSAVDHYRLDLLKDLRIPLPYGSEEERKLWEELGGLTGYGKPMPIVYKHSGA